MSQRITKSSALEQEITLKSRFDSITNLIWPNYCPICRRASSVTELCPDCNDKLQPLITEEACPRCAHSIAPYAAVDGQCPNCRNRRWHITGAARLFPYHETGAELIRLIKFNNQIGFLSKLSDELADSLKNTSWIHEVDAFVEVPTCWTHRLSLPYHLASVLTRHLSRRLGKPSCPILRRRNGPRQVGLSATDRESNVAGKFAIRPGARADRAVICLVDDVMTTGSTINACAGILKKAGVDKVYAAVLATGLGQTIPRNCE
jgi:ComF family protein